MTSLQHDVWQEIKTRQLLRRGEAVLVGVSGGVDSMVLLHLLHAISVSEGWKLTLAHLNHHLRGRSSDADEKLVRKIAAKLRLPVIVGHADVRALARRRKLSVEMAARHARHQFLAKTARRSKIRSIALAHHADDQLELFFIRLFRGTGTEALGGMKWSARSPADPGIQLIRPLLEQPKEALEKFAQEYGIPFREDASNVSLDFARNRIRHELLPLIRKHYQPAVAQSTLRLMKVIGAEADFVTTAAQGWLATRGILCQDRGPQTGSSVHSNGEFDELPLAVQRRCIYLQLSGQGIEPDFELIERLRLHPGTPVTIRREKKGERSLKGNRSRSALRNTQGQVKLLDFTKSKFQTESLTMDLAMGGQVDFGELSFRWQMEAKKGMADLKRVPGTEFFDAHSVGNSIILRHWRAGDRFQPIGMSRAVKLQDLFVNQKVPAEIRRKLALAVTANGDIFWVEGMRISDRFKLTSQTTHRLQWCWQRA